MVKQIVNVVKLADGNFYSELTENHRTKDLSYAKKYFTESQIIGDLLLAIITKNNKANYKIVKVQATYEEIND